MLLKGKDVVMDIEKDVQERVNALKEKGAAATLGIVRVGENPSDIAYENSVTKKAERLGITLKKLHYPEEITQEDLIGEIKKVNKDPSIHGVMIFMPLPKKFNEEKVRNALDPAKDLDGISDISFAKVMANKRGGFPPCTAEACIEMLRYYNIERWGKKAVVIGRSMVIGKPVAMLLLAEHSTVTICHTKTDREALKKYCQDADIIVVAAGHPGTFTRDMAAPGQTVLDVGINVDEEGKLYGDAEFDEVKDMVSAITPVPGGIGGVTSAILLKHLVEAAEATVCRAGE